MRTELIDAEYPGAIERAAAYLKQGSLVAYPTDTLYGVGGDPFNENAISQLYRAKDRSLEKGIPILLASHEALDRVVSQVPDSARLLIERFWPGPLTLILPKHKSLPDGLSPNQNIAVRLPGNDIARRFIELSGGAVATSSANRSGESPAIDANQAMDALQGLIAAVLDGGIVQHGLASTIVDCTAEIPTLLREGPIPFSELQLEKTSVS